MFCRYAGMVATGKNVPERNIIGKVTRFPTTAADSTLFETVPTSIPSETKRNGPSSRNGTISREKVMWAPSKPTPRAVIRKKEIIVRRTYHLSLESSYSVFVRGVSESCLKTLSRLYWELMFTRANIGLVRTEKPTRPGTR